LAEKKKKMVESGSGGIRGWHTTAADSSALGSCCCNHFVKWSGNRMVAPGGRFDGKKALAHIDTSVHSERQICFEKSRTAKN
jgi:hypothetical protein